jgi:hypothetical protein
MVLAMVVGMAVFGGLLSLTFAAAGSDLLHHIGVRAPIMATDMTLGMAIWMRYRGHRWRSVGEMSLAMYVPLVVLLVPFLMGALPGSAVLGPMHLLMLPAMALVMVLRREDYAEHGHHDDEPAPALLQDTVV